jgi:hypothetical protein
MLQIKIHSQFLKNTLVARLEVHGQGYTLLSPLR